MKLKEYFEEEPIGAVNEMAEYLGISSTWLSLIIHGHKKPSRKLAMKIIDATQGLVTIKELFPEFF